MKTSRNGMLKLVAVLAVISILIPLLFLTACQPVSYDGDGVVNVPTDYSTGLSYTYIKTDGMTCLLFTSGDRLGATCNWLEWSRRDSAPGQ